MPRIAIYHKMSALYLSKDAMEEEQKGHGKITPTTLNTKKLSTLSVRQLSVGSMTLVPNVY